MTQDELNNRAITLRAHANSKEGIAFLKHLNEFKDEMMVQHMNERGEGATAAIGLMKGLTMAGMLAEIYEAKSKAAAQAQQQSASQRILKP